MNWQVSRHTVLLTVVWLLAVLLLQFEALVDVDIHWQIRLGQLMLEQGHLITEDSFTFTHEGAPVPTIGWLAQVVFAGLYGLGSWRAVQIAHVMLFAGAFWIAGRSALGGTTQRGQGIGLLSLVCALFLGYVAGASNSTVRPQSFGIFCFAVLLYVVRSDWRLRTKLCLLVPVLLIWQNTHPSVLIGAVAVAALAGAGWLGRIRDPKAAAPWGLTLVVVVVGLAQLVTPMGWHIFETSAANVRVARDLLGVTEWLPPWEETIREAMLGFGLAFVVTAGLLVRLRFRVHLDDLALFAAMTVLALTAARFAVFWALAMVPIWARWIEQIKPSIVFPWPGHVPVRRAAFAMLTGLGLPIALVVPTIMQGAVTDQFALRAGIAQLQQAMPRGRIYNYREWGGPLILAGHPDWQVAIDGRLYLYGEDDWRIYSEAALGEIPLNHLAQRYHPDAFFLHPGFHRRLIARLRQSEIWRELYAGDYCVAFTRSGGAGS